MGSVSEGEGRLDDDAAFGQGRSEKRAHHVAQRPSGEGGPLSYGVSVSFDLNKMVGLQ